MRSDVVGLHGTEGAKASSTLSAMASRLDWRADGADWPQREASRFVSANAMRWHVQQAGTGPSLLLLHGTGASTHTWAGLWPLLAPYYTLIAPDLPGHGFTDPMPAERPSLPAMRRHLQALLQALDVQPQYAAGHSAGAAILADMSLNRTIDARVLFSLNGALLPLHGAAGAFFSPLANVLAVNPLVPRLFSWCARDASSIRRLIGSTGSRLEAGQTELYARLLRSPAHVAGALAMMAAWDLRTLRDRLPELPAHLVLLAGGNDRTVPPAHSRRVQQQVAGSQLVELHGLGHLAHEERPDLIAASILEHTGSNA